LIAFTGSSAESNYEIYVVAPDGTGMRALTSTPDKWEIFPAWSPDGSRLAFLRTTDSDETTLSDPELVIIDPATGVETFTADVFPNPRNATVRPPIRWFPDGRRIALGLGNSGTDLVVDLETNTRTEISAGLWGLSPDGKWLVVGTLLVPTVLLDDTTELLAVDSDVFGVRPLPVPADEFGGTVSWMPDSSAVAISLIDGSVRVVTIADGQYRTLLEDATRCPVRAGCPDGEPSWSPDGRQLAFRRAPVEVEVPFVEGQDVCNSGPYDTDTAAALWWEDEAPDEVWVAAADGTGARAVTASQMAPIWSPDGSLLLGAGPDGLFTVRPDGTGMTIVTPNTLRPEIPDGCSGGWTLPVHFVWQPLPPAADTGETTASAATDE
jgi:Tol biopolymer transport system component